MCPHMNNQIIIIITVTHADQSHLRRCITHISVNEHTNTAGHNHILQCYCMHSYFLLHYPRNKNILALAILWSDLTMRESTALSCGKCGIQCLHNMRRIATLSISAPSSRASGQHRLIQTAVYENPHKATALDSLLTSLGLYSISSDGFMIVSLVTCLTVRPFRWLFVVFLHACWHLGFIRPPLSVIKCRCVSVFKHFGENTRDAVTILHTFPKESVL